MTSPYELAVISMPGPFCTNDLLTSVGPFGISAAGKAALTLPIANNTSLVGKVLTFQWWVAASGQNLLGVVASDGLRLTIGR